MDYEFDSVEVTERKRKMRSTLRRCYVFCFAVAVIAWIPHARELGLRGSLKLWSIALPALVIGCWLGRNRAMHIIERANPRGGKAKEKDTPPPGKDHMLSRALTRAPRGK